MNTVQRIVKNTSVMLIAQIITYILAFLYTIYAARYLGVEGFGIISFALAFSGIIQIISDPGINSLMVREIARDKSIVDKYLRNTGTIKIILGIITLFLSVSIVYILGYETETIIVVLLITSYFIFTSYSYLFYSIFQAHERMEFQSLGQILNSILIFSGTVIAIFFGFNVLGFALIYFITGALVFVYSLIICIKKFTLPKMEFDFKLWKKLIKLALPLCFALVFTSIYFKIDTVLLSLLQGNIVVGWYSAAYRLMEQLILVPLVFTESVYPIFSNYYVSSKDSLEIAYIRIFKYLSLLGLPIAVGVTVLAPKIIYLIYGTGYTESIIALQILIWTIPFIFLTQAFQTLFISINKQYVLLKLIFIVMIFNIIFNILIIPIYSYIGSSFITILSELILFILGYYYLSRFICKVDIKFVLKPVIASLIMGIFIFYIDFNLFLQIIMATLIYFLALFLLKTFSKEDFDIIRQVIVIKNKSED